MKRLILFVMLGLLTATLVFAGSLPSLAKIILRADTSANHSEITQVTRRTKRAPRRHHRMHRHGQLGTGLQTGTARPRLSPQIAAVLLPQYSVQGTVNLAPFSPKLVAVDPYANAVSSADGLKPVRPFWYAVDSDGLTILRLDDNKVVRRVSWPQTLDLALPEGDGPDFMTINAPSAGWEPVSMMVSYPTEEALASTSETPAAYVFVVMAHSGYEWASNPNPPDLRDPGVRDSIVPATSPETESSILLQLDVTDPSFSPDTFPTGPIWAGALLGHGAGQLAFDPSLGNVYVGNMPSLSLPQGPRDLTSFVSVIMPIAVAENAAAEPASGAPADPPLVLCGPEHPDEGLAVGMPYVWPCVAEGGEAELVWEFDGLPSWVMVHHDKLTAEVDGILYGTPPTTGTWTFRARVTDLGENPGVDPPNVSEWTTVTLNVTAAAAWEAGEVELEVGVPGGAAIAGTGDCTPAPTLSPGSMVPRWIDVQSAYLDGTVRGCYVMGTPPISGEYYEFAIPGFKFDGYPNTPVIFSGNVLGTYGFDPLPAGIGLSGLAWHEIDKIHDPSTEADILNQEFIGVEPFTGQLYRILAPIGVLGEAAGPPETANDIDEVSILGNPLLTTLTTLRGDIANALSANPNLKVKFGDVVVEASRDPNIYVTAAQILDPTGSNPTIIPIGGPEGSAIASGALMKVTATRDAVDPAGIEVSGVTTLNLAGAQALFLGLDSDLSPAIRGQEKGQVDHGVLWVSGTTTGNVGLVDTALGQVAQSLTVPGATSLGGVSLDLGTRSGHVAATSLQNLTIFGSGTSRPPSAPLIWTGGTATFYIGQAASFPIVASGSPTPTISVVGALPTGVTLVDNGDGTATLAGTPAEGTGNDYNLTITATNGVSPDASFAVILTVVSPPTITGPNTATFTVGVPGSFSVTTTGAPSLLYVYLTGAPSWLIVTTDEATGVTTLDGTPPVGSQGTYVFTITASTGTPPDANQIFTLIVNPQGPSAPAITSANATSLTVGFGGALMVTATGWPTPALSLEGTLPGGVTFVDNGNGSGILGGTPAAGTEGSYPLLIAAANGTLPSATQNFTLTVNIPTAPAITSVDSATFTIASAGWFTVTATGSPTPALSETGALPNGMTFVDNGNGTGTLGGTPAAGTEGSFPFIISAANGVQADAHQNFNLTIKPAPTPPTVSMHPSSQTVLVGQTATFTSEASGDPVPAVQWQLSSDGVSWSNITGATSTAYTTPVVTATMNRYRYRAMFTNSAGTAYSNAALLTVNAPPAITSAAAAVFTVGSAGSFTVTASGLPAPNLSLTGGLPGGVTFVDNGNGTATLAGTPATSTQGSYPLILAAVNGFSPNATQNFTLTVNPAPATVPVITMQPTGQTVTAGQTATFTSSASGNPAPTVQWQFRNRGAWSDIPGATSTSYTTPTTTTAMNGYQYRAVFTNRAGSTTTNSALLTVNSPTAALTVVTTSLPDGRVGTTYSAQLQANGGTQPYTWSLPSGSSLPAGLALSSTGQISGTPSAAGNYQFTVQVNDSASHSASRRLSLRIARQR